MEHLNIGNLVRIKGKEGNWRVSGIGYRKGDEDVYHFSLVGDGEGKIVSMKKGRIVEKVEGIEIGKVFLGDNGFIHGEGEGEDKWREMRREIGDRESVLLYDLVGKNFVIKNYGDIVREGKCEYIHEMQDMISESGNDDIGRTMVLKG